MGEERKMFSLTIHQNSKTVKELLKESLSLRNIEFKTEEDLIRFLKESCESVENPGKPVLLYIICKSNLFTGFLLSLGCNEEDSDGYILESGKKLNYVIL